MKILGTIALASAMALATVSPAQARQGCGAGFHRGPMGHCRPNRHREVVWVVGRYYPGHGYWYNNQWWRHCYHNRFGWHCR